MDIRDNPFRLGFGLMRLPRLEDGGACAQGDSFEVGDGYGAGGCRKARLGEGENALALENRAPFLRVTRAVHGRAASGKQGKRDEGC